MKKAYIILAHKAPSQLMQLLQKLDDGFSTFFVHIDKKSIISDFDMLKSLGDKVVFTSRVNGQWGSFGLVDATLQAMQAVTKHNENFRFVHLLSGQDYPIKSNNYINQFLENTNFNVFMEYFPIPNYDRWVSDGGLYRIKKYNFGRKKHQVYLAKSINFLSGIFDVFSRKIPYNVQPYGGSQWWSMDLYTMRKILDYINKHPKFLSFFKYSFTPDEMFFQTLIINMGGIKVCNDNLRFIKWNNYSDAHPILLSESNLSEIKNSTALFARKIDFDYNFQVVPLIEDIIM